SGPAARAPALDRRAARRRGPLGRGGLPAPRPQPGEPARAAAPRTLAAPGGSRGVPRRRRHVTNSPAGRLKHVHSSGPPHNGHSASAFDLPADEVTCEEFFEGALQARTLSQVEEHLVMCDWCVTYVVQMRATIGSLRELSEEYSPEPPDA